MKKKKQHHKTKEEIIREMEIKKLQKQQAEFMESFKEKYPELFDEDGNMIELSEGKLIDIDGCLIKFDQDRMNAWLERDDRVISQKYKDWYSENKDKKFIAHKMNSHPLSQYELDGVDGWTFNYYDLIKAENPNE